MQNHRQLEEFTNKTLISLLYQAKFFYFGDNLRSKGDSQLGSIPEEVLDNNTTLIASCTSWLTFVMRHVPILAKKIVPVLIKRRGGELYLNEYANNQR